MADNFTQYPNSIYDHLSIQGLPLTAYLSPAEEKVLNRCIRETNGWHRSNFRMSLSDMAKLTGLSKQGVINSIKTLCEAKVLEYNPNNGVAIFTLKLDLESAFNYYISKCRSTELTVNNSQVRTTECTKPSTECTDKAQSGKLSLPPSNKEKNQINIQINTTTTASQNDAQKVCEVKPSQVIQPTTTNNDNLISAYCEALQWDIRQQDCNRKATKAIKELTALYPDITANSIKEIINHAIQAHGLKQAQLASNWLKLSNEVSTMHDDGLKAIVGEIKAIYGLNGNTPHGKLWDIYGIAIQARQIYKLQPDDFRQFPARWSATGLNLPGIDKLLANVVKAQGEKHNESTKRNITGIGVGKIDPTVWTELESRTI